ncbi:MAG: LodA/GoxA family CTQ-dependent oxidase [Kangiellaceae bacterium]
MAFPDDLSNVGVFKIHPAIGCARLANNDEYYEFFDYEQKRNAGQAQDLNYMAIQDGDHRVMRQAVQYKIFAYDDSGRELGELSQDVMDQLRIQTTWTAAVANRKLNNWSGGVTPVVEAKGSAEGNETLRLEGDNPWRQGKVWLGEITGEGLFIPPKGGVYRKDENTIIPPYSNSGTYYYNRDNGVLDSTSDGAVTVVLSGSGAGEITVIPACVIVAPQQHSPDVNPGDIDDGRNTDFVEETRDLLSIPDNGTLNGDGYAMDIAMMKTMNAEYSPGMEICLNPGASLPVPGNAFYTRGQAHIDENEIRPSYESGHANHGALTAGLCSTWQTDLNACLNYWTAEFPNRLRHDDAPRRRYLSRKIFSDDVPQMVNNEDLNVYIDNMGIGRNRDGSISRLRETERVDDNNVGATPRAPFPLEPEE